MSAYLPTGLSVFGLRLCLGLHILALFAWFGCLSLRYLLADLGPDARTSRTTRSGRALRALPLEWTWAILALLSAALWPCLQAAALADDPAAGTTAAQVVALLTRTSFGRIWLWRDGLIGVAVLSLALPSARLGRVRLLFLGLALASLALLGHAAGHPGLAGSLERSALALHLLAAGAWLGALLPLWVLAGRLAPRLMAAALQRFSRWAVWWVAAVLTTGAYSAWARTGSWAFVGATAYGRLILTKVALLALMGVLALLNRNRWTPRLAGAAAPGQLAARRGLRRTLLLEALVGLAAIACAVVLGASEPAR